MSGKIGSPHSLSQWFQINEIPVLKHMCFLFPNLCPQHSQDLNLKLYVQNSPVLVTKSQVANIHLVAPNAGVTCVDELNL